jgi:4-hydroxy-3-methylbut-2-enyl diphosphate reductase
MFSAHGVAKSVVEQAKNLNLFSLDATCPLVTKVHREVDLHNRMNRKILMIGHRGHPEVLGTMGQLLAGEVILIETVEEAQTKDIPQTDNLTYVTQTTLSIDETQDIIVALKLRFPHIIEPKREDICYATTNRQEAVKRIAPEADLFLVVGGKNSSNSNRLVETAKLYGTKHAYLIESVEDIDWASFDNVKTMGLSSGASAPEYLIDQVIEACRTRFDMTLEPVIAIVEDTVFNLPRLLAA